MPGDAYLWAWDYFPGPSDNITSLVTIAALGLSADHCSLATACSPASRKAACFHHQSPPVHRCSAVPPPPTSCIACTAPAAIQRSERRGRSAVVCCIAQVQLFFSKEVFAWFSVFMYLLMLRAAHFAQLERKPGVPVATTRQRPALSLLPAIYLTGCYNLPSVCSITIGHGGNFKLVVVNSYF